MISVPPVWEWSGSADALVAFRVRKVTATELKRAAGRSVPLCGRIEFNDLLQCKNPLQDSRGITN